MQLQKRLSALACIILMFLVTGMTVRAYEAPDSSKKGSISVAMTYDGSYVPGGTLTLYRVGAVAEENGNYSFILTGDFAGSDVELKDITSADLAEMLAEYAKSQNISGTEMKIGSNGKAAFSGLELGLYLIMQKEAAEGYETAAPFLVSIPMNENGTYIYNVDASPKIELKADTEPLTPPSPSTPPDTVLPQTGQLNWPVPVLAVLGLALFGIGWMLRFRQKKERL